jgi:PleD family two-component response regulator
MSTEGLVQKQSNVLLVDDTLQNLEALKAILASSAYDVVLATSATEALREVVQRDFAVILIDVRMPDIDGFQCARLIRQREQSRATPIIFVTAEASEMEVVFKAYDTGAVDYITKPLEPTIVKAKVAVFTRLYEERELLKEQLDEMRRFCCQLERKIADFDARRNGGTSWLPPLQPAGSGGR